MSMLQPSETLFVHLPSRKGRSGQSNAINALEQSMDQFAKDGSWEKVDFILVLLQVQDDFIYPCIKRLAAVKFGVHTQCLQLDRALEKKARDRYLSNVVLKVNMKLGGVNHHLHPSSMVWLSQKSTMMVGMDVTHPSPGCAPETPSIAGVVASTGLDFVQFPASLRLQKSRQEGIEGLAGMVIERLEAYKEHNDSLPERILVFRDGVSEGQYDKVLREELPQIFEAFKRVDPGNAAYRPALSVVICGKRHNVRIYPTSEGDADENGNTRPGTVVDQGITSVRDFDFYLQAHAATQGTVRSAHYIVLYDENNLRVDDIQQGVHSASYLWACATKAVSLVPAAYYAHVLCEQARYWIQGLSYYEGLETGVNGKEMGNPRIRLTKEAREASVYLAAQKMWAGGLHENLKDSMFYL
ncbi:Piwi domain-containing protein [Amylostereum chailletii]|nr:Piwi domain-containing protein [Amylostereum chailletii]